MHELALAQGILEVVLDVADGQRPRTVRVRAGETLAVAAESLQFCFELVAQDTAAAHAQLEMEIVPGDGLLIDAIELDDGWHYRPALTESLESVVQHDWTEHAAVADEGANSCA